MTLQGTSGIDQRGSHPIAERVYVVCLVAIAVVFSTVFFVWVVPGLLPMHDFIRKSLLDGYVNPTAAGYTSDTLACAAVLTTWVIYERITLGVRGGWIALLISFVPGVAVGFAAYLLIRMRSLRFHVGEGSVGGQTALR